MLIGIPSRAIAVQKVQADVLRRSPFDRLNRVDFPPFPIAGRRIIAPGRAANVMTDERSLVRSFAGSRTRPEEPTCCARAAGGASPLIPNLGRRKLRRFLICWPCGAESCGPMIDRDRTIKGGHVPDEAASVD
jgi:hypothetical protein